MIFGWGKKKETKFTDLEKAILDSVSTVLKPDAQARFLEQLQCIKAVDRDYKGKQVGWPLRFPKQALFSLPKDTYYLARVKLEAQNSSRSNTAEILVLNGSLCGIEFVESPEENPALDVVNAILLQNPMGQTFVPEQHIEAELPIDYLELLQQHVTTINEWEIFDWENIRIVVDPGKNFYLLAEKHGAEVAGTLTVRRGATDGNLHFVNYNGGDVSVVGTSLRDACARL